MNTLSLEDMAFIGYISGNHNIYVNPIFNHLLKLKPRLASYMHIIAEIHYLEANRPICYDCHQYQDIYQLYTDWIFVMLPNLVSQLSINFTEQFIASYIKGKIRNSTNLCCTCSELLIEDDTYL